jgi:UDP-N-acetylmuramate-alanine ligase
MISSNSFICQANHIFILGIKGAAMANMARMLSQMGKKVSGWDVAEEFITDKVLQDLSITITTDSGLSQNDNSLDTIDLVIYSAAHGGKHNPFVVEAEKRGIKVMHQAEVLGELMKEFTTSIAVCGCHGKTTTSSLLAYALKKLETKPSYMIGTSVFVGKDAHDEYYGGEYSGKDYFVLEADEYGMNPPHDKTPKLNYLHPTHVIATNIDFDHPDVYENIEHTKEVFLAFFQKVIQNSTNNEQLETHSNVILGNEVTPESTTPKILDALHKSSLTRMTSNNNETIEQSAFAQPLTLRLQRSKSYGRTQLNNQRLFFCADDEHLMSVAAQLPPNSYLTYGYSKEADLQIVDVKATEEHTEFSINVSKLLITNYQLPISFSIPLFGNKIISNVAGVILALLQLGFKPEDIQHAVRGFTGAKRRFEQVAFVNNTYLFDDYAHHPHEIETTIQAARSRFPTRRIVVIFQPHTYSRTESLKQEFIQALAKADVTFLMPIFASAREKVSDNAISSVKLAELAKEQQINIIHGFATNEEMINQIKQLVKSGDVIFTMGAGDVYKLKDDIIAIISSV